MAPSLAVLGEAQRARLLEELAAIGDLRRGSITATWRRCGRANCACAAAGHPGHGPRHLLTRSVAGRTRARQLATDPELDKARQEVAAHKRFSALAKAIVEVDEAICEARPVRSLADELDRRGPRRAGRPGARRGLGELVGRARERRGHGYVTVDRERMRYPWFRSQGLCVSSGVVETCGKVVMGTRLKPAEMRWTLAGADAILALRACLLGGRFDAFWERRSPIRRAHQPAGSAAWPAHHASKASKVGAIGSG